MTLIAKLFTRLLPLIRHITGQFVIFPLLTMVGMVVHAGPEAALTQIDLPACEASAPGSTQGISIGLVQPYTSEHVLNYAARLTLKHANVSVCSESWSSVLPRWVPWASELERGHGFAAFALAFVLAVTGLWLCTPREFWRRTTLLGVLGVGFLTWVLGVGFMAGFHALGGQRLLYGTVVSLHTPKQGNPAWFDVKGARELEAVLAQLGVLPDGAAQDTPATGQSDSEGVTNSATVPAPSGAYRVYHRLNVREASGIQSAWIATLTRGDEVQFDGATQGDWWRIRIRTGQIGWASSLWLRRPQEMSASMAELPKS